MRYILTDSSRAAQLGFTGPGHRTKNGRTLLNEKEVMFAPSLTGTFEQRAAQTGGTVMTAREAMIYFQND